MKWLLVIAGIGFGLGLTILLALLIFGWLQPVRHSVTRSVHLRQKPEAVFALIANAEDCPTWSSAVLRVERLPSHDDKPVFRETLRWGGMQMIMTELERTPPTRLVTAMAKEGGPTLGTWTYEIAPETDGCRVQITEQGDLENPIFRALARLRGLDANILHTLRDVQKKFGEG
jgi:hypothetical protein